MIYLLTGLDTYSREDRVQEIRETYRKKYPDAFGEVLLSLDDTDVVERLATALTQGGGLFSAKSLVIAREVLGKNTEQLESLFASTDVATSEDSILVLVEDRLPKGAALTKKHATEETFNPLKGESRVKWIARYVQKHGPEEGPKKIGQEAASLIESGGGDLWNLSQELEKLLSYAAGEEQVRVEHINALLSFRDEETIFPISDGIGERSPTTALAAIARLASEREDVAGLIGYAIKEARQIIRAHSAIGAELPESPEDLFGAKQFVWRKRSSQARNWDEETIKVLVSALLETDAARRSSLDERLALERLILRAQK